jgi:hypothetical protein
MHRMNTIKICVWSSQDIKHVVLYSDGGGGSSLSAENSHELQTEVGQATGACHWSNTESERSWKRW